MDSPKYLIIITLLDGQNFTVPDGAHDRIDASVYAEARFGNESTLKSDPIRLTSSNPEFVTELAWQIDKRSLHQLRVERRSIKFQVFMQTCEKKKQPNHQVENGNVSAQSDATHKVELIGYTIIDIRSAQEGDQPKFQWLPLLNPKFRKSSYNRPEVQLALSLSRIDPVKDASLDSSPQPDDDLDSSQESRLYKTCLNQTAKPDSEEILENDIVIKHIDGKIYIYDARNSEECSQQYKLTVKVPFNSDLDTLTDKEDDYYFSVDLFGTIMKTPYFDELTSVETREITFDLCTSNQEVLATYFELHSNLEIKFHESSGEALGSATIQLDQLCSLDRKRRSIEGIFALQSLSEREELPCRIYPTIGVSVILERLHDDSTRIISHIVDEQSESTQADMAKEYFGDDIDEYLNDHPLDITHALTMRESTLLEPDARSVHHMNELQAPLNEMEDDRHFCFTIDLKSFSYSTNQRLIPTLRELVVRFSYPFFGYEDPITTDASVPISQTSSIIVSGMCEFNFATTRTSLLTALREVPLDLQVLTCDHVGAKTDEKLVASCTVNLADVMSLTDASMLRLQDRPVRTTTFQPIYDTTATEIGQIQIFLCLKDLGHPSFDFKASVENLHTNQSATNQKAEAKSTSLLDEMSKAASTSLDQTAVDDNLIKFDQYLADAKRNLDRWKEDYTEKLSEEIKKRENERFKRIYQRLEAKDVKREQEHKRKMDELAIAENRYKLSMKNIDSLERKVSTLVEQLKAKDAMLDSRLDMVDMVISKAINDIKLEYERRMDKLPISARRALAGSADGLASSDNQLSQQRASQISSSTNRISSLKSSAQSNDTNRRSSLRTSQQIAGIPMPIRSTSLVRAGTSSGRAISDNGFAHASGSTRLVKRPSATLVNGVRPRSGSNRVVLSKERQEKLASLRRGKAELLKRGCRPNDELIKEINSLIEKLAC